MFANKFPKLTASAHKDQHSDHDLDALNKELLDRHVRGLAIIRQNDLHEFEQSLSQAIESNTKLEAQVLSLVTERDNLKRLVDEYGDQPGALRTSVNKKKDELDTSGCFAVDMSSDYNRRALKATGAVPSK